MPLIGNKKGRPTSKIYFKNIVNRFTLFVKKELAIKYDIPVVFIDDIDFAKDIRAFGQINVDNIIKISIINRHPMDILRTLAHEYVHYKQHIEKGLQHTVSHPGDKTENQANAKAGEIMRKYGQMHPELFDLMPIR